MPRPSNTDERRAQITAALVRVMARRGYDGASVVDIAKAARLTPGLVHYHFKNKQAILLAALGDLVSRHEVALGARLDAAGEDPHAELEAFIDFHLRLGTDADPETLACWIVLSGEALRERRVRTGYEHAIATSASRLAAIIRRGLDSKAFGAVDLDADAAASALVATIQGYFVLAATARATIPRGSAARMTKRMAEGLLRPVRPLDGQRERS
jgi:TetR/AcrR family transcriptional repressor of bet genes